MPYMGENRPLLESMSIKKTQDRIEVAIAAISKKSGQKAPVMYNAN